MKRYGPILVALCALTAVAVGGTIRRWQDGDTLTAADLNAAFSHIHNTMVGQHGPRLLNEDVSATAAIGKAKMKKGETVPKGWFIVNNLCLGVAPIACTVDYKVGFDTVTVTKTGAGVYTVSFSLARTNAAYSVFVTAVGTPLAPATCHAILTTFGTSSFTVRCYDSGGAGAVVSRFMVTLFDDNFLAAE